MKYTHALGSLFLTALQASANPVDVSTSSELSPDTLEARDGTDGPGGPGWCCVGG